MQNKHTRGRHEKTKGGHGRNIGSRHMRRLDLDDQLTSHFSPDNRRFGSQHLRRLELHELHRVRAAWERQFCRLSGFHFNENCKSFLVSDRKQSYLLKLVGVS